MASTEKETYKYHKSQVSSILRSKAKCQCPTLSNALPWRWWWGQKGKWQTFVLSHPENIKKTLNLGHGTAGQAYNICIAIL